MSDLSRIIHEAIRLKRTFCCETNKKKKYHGFSTFHRAVAYGISRTLRSMLDCHRLKPLWPPKVLWESHFL